MIARPARVRIRSRKPWVLDRRRLFGWKVRLLTRYSYDTTSAVAPPPAGGAARGAGGTGADAAPATPGKLVPADGTRPVMAGTGARRARHIQLTAQDPSTDCDQHSRGIPPADGRPDTDSPACTSAARCRSRRAGHHRCRRAGSSPRIVAG